MDQAVNAVRDEPVCHHADGTDRRKDASSTVVRNQPPAITSFDLQICIRISSRIHALDWICQADAGFVDASSFSESIAVPIMPSFIN